MLHTRICPKCGARGIQRIPDNPGRDTAGNNIYTTTLTRSGKIPVIRYVCLSCGYVENWVENPEQLEKLRRSFGR